jgi:hypothetical protein
MDENLRLAKNCRHYSMCKIDFLGAGICSSGLKKQYASYYPVGRMDLYEALMEKKIPVTPEAIEIANTCTLCNKCEVFKRIYRIIFKSGWNGPRGGRR